jgi:hypothetical protein
MTADMRFLEISMLVAALLAGGAAAPRPDASAPSLSLSGTTSFACFPAAPLRGSSASTAADVSSRRSLEYRNRFGDKASFAKPIRKMTMASSISPRGGHRHK